MINPIVSDGGVAGALFRSIDWSKTSLGSQSQWPVALKSALRVLFHTPQSMILFWGKDSICFYNEAFLNSLSAEDSFLRMGAEGESIWRHHWSPLKDSIHTVMSKKKPMNISNHVLVPSESPQKMKRTWSVYFSPVLCERNLVQGVLALCHQNQSSTKLEGFKFLIVEDSSDSQLLLKKMLTKAGACVDLANDGKEGVQKALSNQYDLVLMDIQMPVMNGFEALAALHEVQYRTPVVALTAHAMLEDKRRALEAGFKSHLSKPLNSKTLFDTLTNLL